MFFLRDFVFQGQYAANVKQAGADLFILSSVSGGGPEGEDAEHGEVPADGHGHGTSCGQEKPEQLEFTFPLVAMETAI